MDARRVSASLPKATRLCQASLLLLCLLQAATADEIGGDLRECVAAATNAAAVGACEATEQAVLKERIERWSRAIRTRLDNRQRVLFDRSLAAWRTWFESETELLDLTLAQRTDGLGPKLRSGAVTRLYEERERQLREHLHNLSYASSAPPPR